METIINDEAMKNVNGGAARITYDTGRYVLYTVVPGDYLSAIAARYGVLTDVLYAINHSTIGPNPNLIQPGMVLRIPTL